MFKIHYPIYHVSRGSILTTSSLAEKHWSRFIEMFCASCPPCLSVSSNAKIASQAASFSFLFFLTSFILCGTVIVTFFSRGKRLWGDHLSTQWLRFPHHVLTYLTKESMCRRHVDPPKYCDRPRLFVHI